MKMKASVVYRKIYNQSLWHCPNAKQGCEEKILGKNLGKHKQDCNFRLVTKFTHNQINNSLYSVD